jgi:hypothetical protein
MGKMKDKSSCIFFGFVSWSLRPGTMNGSAVVREVSFNGAVFVGKGSCYKISLLSDGNIAPSACPGSYPAFSGLSRNEGAED